MHENIVISSLKGSFPPNPKIFDKSTRNEKNNRKYIFFSFKIFLLANEKKHDRQKILCDKITISSLKFFIPA